MDTSTDEGKALAEAISEYQNWYEKAEDCKQAVIDLRNEQQKLFEQWANMPTEKAEKKIDRLTTGYNGINAVSSRLTAATKGGSTQAVLAQTMKEDLTEAKEQKKSDNKDVYKRQVLMENYDRVQKYTDVAANSEGSGEQKFDLYLEGLEAKTNSLKASLESLSSSVISRDLYAGFLDGSKAVVDFTEKTGLLKGALAGLGTAGATYALSQLVSMATGATKEFSNLSNALKMVKAAESTGTFDTSNMASLINLTKGLSKSQTKLVLSSTALSDAQRVAAVSYTHLDVYKRQQQL